MHGVFGPIVVDQDVRFVGRRKGVLPVLYIVVLGSWNEADWCLVGLAEWSEVT